MVQGKIYLRAENILEVLNSNSAGDGSCSFLCEPRFSLASDIAGRRLRKYICMEVCCVHLLSMYCYCGTARRVIWWLVVRLNPAARRVYLVVDDSTSRQPQMSVSIGWMGRKTSRMYFYLMSAKQDLQLTI